MAQPFIVSDFGGGMTDYWVDGKPNCAMTLENWVVVGNNDLEARPGSVLWTTAGHQIPPGAQRIGFLGEVGGVEYTSSSRSLYAYGGTPGAWTEMKGEGAHWADGILGTGPLRKKVDAALLGGLTRSIVSVSKVRLEDGRLMFANGCDKDFVDSVIASCSIPGIISPVIDEFTGDHYVDGGTRENVPLKRAIDMGADRIIVVLCSPWGQNPSRWFGSSGGWFAFVDNAMRALDITLHEVMVNDIETCLEKNLSPDKRQIEVVIYAPQFEPCGTMDFNPEAICKAIALGKNAKPVVLQRRDGRAA